MSIDPNESREDQWVLAAYDAELSADPTFTRNVEKIERSQAITPSHPAETWVAPALERVQTGRDRLRIWAPGLAGTAAVAVVLIGPGPIDIPLTGPLIAYGIAFAAFGWWTAAGRPGPRDSAALVLRAGSTVARWIAVAAVAVAGISVKAGRIVAQGVSAPVRRARSAEQAGGAA